MFHLFHGTGAPAHKGPSHTVVGEDLFLLVTIPLVDLWSFLPPGARYPRYVIGSLTGSSVLFKQVPSNPKYGPGFQKFEFLGFKN